MALLTVATAMLSLALMWSTFRALRWRGLVRHQSR
jgi:hypothetical protein